MALCALLLLLLGATAILGTHTSCDDLRKSLLNAKQWTDNFSGDFKMGDPVLVQSTYFKTATTQLSIVTIEGVHRHVHSVYPSGPNHPRVTVDGKSYNLHDLAISNLNTSLGTAALAVTFYQDENIEPTREVVFVVPVLRFADGDRNLNEDLTNSLSRLRATPDWGIKNISFAWLQPILSRVDSMISTAEYVKVFMTDCQYVDADCGIFDI